MWREDIQPKTAVRARVVPLLEEERDTLRARLQEVRLVLIRRCWIVVLIVCLVQFEAENLRLQEELERTRGQKQEVEDQTVEMLDQLEEVCAAPSLVAHYSISLICSFHFVRYIRHGKI